MSKLWIVKRGEPTSTMPERSMRVRVHGPCETSHGRRPPGVRWDDRGIDQLLDDLLGSSAREAIG